jgi:nucleotide-binding universal stress UspA family protein
MLKVVLAYDGSVQAQKAVDCLSWWPNGSLNVIAITALLGPALDENGDAVDVDPYEFSRAEIRFEELEAALEKKGIPLQYRIVAGDPRDVIVDIAQKEGADLIVTGSRGLNLARRMLLGSVSSDILQQAPCPVLLVR